MPTRRSPARLARRPGTICTSTAHPHEAKPGDRHEAKPGCRHQAGQARGGQGADDPRRRRGPAALAGIGLIRLYRLTLSPFIGQSCRYLPTCSSYGEEAIGRHGLWAGGWMTLARLQRCGPFGASGFDPVPETLRADARWYLPWRYGRWTGRHIDPATRLDR